MIQYIWAFMIIVGIVFSFFNGTTDKVVDVILDSPKTTFNLIIEIGVMMVFFSGILGIAKDGGLLKSINKITKKIIKPLFKDLDENSDAFLYITGNISANLLGLGSAATPMGLRAMEELNKNNENKTRATKEMITLLIINTSGFTLIPTSLIAIRRAYNAQITTQIIPYVIIASLITTALALVVDYLFRRFKK